MTSPNQPGPGRPPTLGYSSPATAPGAIDRTVIKKFREQIHALGGLWILIGGLAGALVVFASAASGGAGAGAGGGITSPLAGGGGLLLGVVGALALFWITLGVFTCMKQMWAVYVGLVLSYISAAGNLIQFNLCGLIILAVVILQAHRVIGWAKQMRLAGVPYNAKP
jgi:hypothetical protein